MIEVDLTQDVVPYVEKENNRNTSGEPKQKRRIIQDEEDDIDANSKEGNVVELISLTPPPTYVENEIDRSAIEGKLDDEDSKLAQRLYPCN